MILSNKYLNEGGEILESVKQKIQKLLILAADTSDEESHTAMLQARKLMLKYNISKEELFNNHYVSEKTVSNEKVYRSKLLWWHKKLAVIISEHFRCNVYLRVINSHCSEVRFVGLKEDVEIASLIFHFARASIHYQSRLFLLRPEIKRKWKRKNLFKKDYINGYLSGLNQKFKDQNESESLDLLLVQDALVVEYFSSLTLSKSTVITTKTAGDAAAWQKGFKDGQAFESERTKISL